MELKIQYNNQKRRWTAGEVGEIREKAEEDIMEDEVG